MLLVERISRQFEGFTFYEVPAAHFPTTLLYYLLSTDIDVPLSCNFTINGSFICSGGTWSAFFIWAIRRACACNVFWGCAVRGTEKQIWPLFAVKPAAQFDSIVIANSAWNINDCSGHALWIHYLSSIIGHASVSAVIRLHRCRITANSHLNYHRKNRPEMSNVLEINRRAKGHDI